MLGQLTLVVGRLGRIAGCLGGSSIGKHERAFCLNSSGYRVEKFGRACSEQCHHELTTHTSKFRLRRLADIGGKACIDAMLIDYGVSRHPALTNMVCIVGKRLNARIRVEQNMISIPFIVILVCGVVLFSLIVILLLQPDVILLYGTHFYQQLSKIPQSRPYTL